MLLNPKFKLKMEKNEKVLSCQRCGREWIYRGHAKYYTSCPNCKSSISLGFRKPPIAELLPEQPQEPEQSPEIQQIQKQEQRQALKQEQEKNMSYTLEIDDEEQEQKEKLETEKEEEKEKDIFRCPECNAEVGVYQDCSNCGAVITWQK